MVINMITGKICIYMYVPEWTKTAPEGQVFLPHRVYTTLPILLSVKKTW